MEEEGDAFYVVRKGNTVGVYKSLKDCQSQVWDPTFSVYKGRCLSKQAEEYLAFSGLKNAAYSICSTDLKEDVFGTLFPCSHQEPDGIFSSFGKRSSKTVDQKRSVEVRDACSVNEASGSAVVSNEHYKHQKLIDSTARPIACYSESLTLQVEQSEKNKNYCGSRTNISKSRNGVGMVRKKYYVVFKGREQGIYTSWDECQQQVHRCKGACFRAFKTEVEAIDQLRAFIEVEREEKQKAIHEKALDEMALQGMVTVARGMHIAYGLKLCMDTCVLEFDGASKGNPGKAGAGAILRMDGGTTICRLREGVGVATNNFAEYRAVILGMKCALRKGFTRIKVQGDSMLVCMQIQNIWQTKNKNILDLSNEAKKLKDRFLSFQINHIRRELNSEADRQANLAIDLADGEVEEEYENKLILCV
ncbi:unnamed protein product [Victoria cruziana]